MRLSKGSNLFEDTFRQTYWVYGFPVSQDQDKTSQVVRFDIVLVYSISADAGNETIILAKRCSVTSLKCICCVEIKICIMTIMSCFKIRIKVLAKNSYVAIWAASFYS
jgi:hypothetical protein